METISARLCKLVKYNDRIKYVYIDFILNLMESMYELVYVTDLYFDLSSFLKAYCPIEVYINGNPS